MDRQLPAVTVLLCRWPLTEGAHGVDFDRLAAIVRRRHAVHERDDDGVQRCDDLAGRALAFVRSRSYALPQDVRDLALDVIRHRLVLSYEALADNVSPDDLLDRILDAVPMPEVPLHERHRTRAAQ